MDRSANTVREVLHFKTLAFLDSQTLMKINDVTGDRMSVSPAELGLHLSSRRACDQMALSLYSAYCVSFGSISKENTAM